MSETARRHDSDGYGRDEKRSGWDGAWSVCCGVFATLGLACAIGSWGWLPPLLLTLSTAVCAGCVANAARGLLGARLRDRAATASWLARVGVVCGLGTTAAAGLVAVLDVYGVLVVFAMGAPSPAVGGLLVWWWSTAAGRPDGRSGPASSSPMRDVHAAADAYAEPLPDLRVLDDRALCMAW